MLDKDDIIDYMNSHKTVKIIDFEKDLEYTPTFIYTISEIAVWLFFNQRSNYPVISYATNRELSAILGYPGKEIIYGEYNVDLINTIYLIDDILEEELKIMFNNIQNGKPIQLSYLL